MSRGILLLFFAVVFSASAVRAAPVHENNEDLSILSMFYTDEHLFERDAAIGGAKPVGICCLDMRKCETPTVTPCCELCKKGCLCPKDMATTKPKI